MVSHHRDGLKVEDCRGGSLRAEQDLVLQFVGSMGWGLCVVGHRLGAILILWLGLQTNCVVVWHGSPPHFTGRWDDRSCVEEKHGYICQRKIGRVWGDRALLCRGGSCCKHPTLWECHQWGAMGSSSGEHGAMSRRQTVRSTWPLCFLGNC